MSGLFPKKRINQKSRLSSAESDNDDEKDDEMLSDFDNFDTKLKKKKSSITSIKRTTSTSQTPISTQSQVPPSKNDSKPVVAIDLDDSPDLKEKKPAVQVDEDLSSTYAEFAQFVDNTNEKDQEMEYLRQLKRKITDSSLPANKKPTKPIDVSDLTVESGNEYNETLQRLYSIPKVISAKERNELIRQKSSSGQSNAPEMKPNVPMITIKTRINGNDERKWQIPYHDSFRDFQQQISSFYDIPISKFSVIFDGRGINFEESPEGMDMEYDDLLDIKIEKSLLAKALEKAKESSESISASQANKKPAANVRMITLKTRINGNDERKWQIPYHDSFHDFQQQISSFYGVPVAKLSVIFDGRGINFATSPEEMDLENDDLLDIKIDKSLLAKALEKAKGK